MARSGEPVVDASRVFHADLITLQKSAKSRRVRRLLLIPLLCTCFTGCHTTAKPPRVSTHSDGGGTRAYPASWWTPIPKEGAPAWEILPQEAGPGEVILSKRNELGLLSNFAATPFTYRGVRYASLEGFWQAMKFPENTNDPRATFPGLTWPYTREQVSQMVAFEAKHAGTVGEQNMKKMGITWVTFEGSQLEYRPKEPGEHYRLIVEATREKVRQNTPVQAVLLQTGTLILKPDHHQETNAPAAWRYYDILMQIRSELQAAK